MTAKIAAPRQYAVVVLLCSLIAFAASLALLHAEITHLANPNEIAACDLNSLFGCGTSLNSAPAHLLLGLPNSAIGIAAFALLMLIALLDASGTTLPKWLWWAVSLGSIGGLCWVGYFVFLSITHFAALCPYCTVVWFMTIPIAIFTLGYANARAYVPLVGFGAHLWNYRWLYTFALWAAIVIAVLIGLPSQVAELF